MKGHHSKYIIPFKDHNDNLEHNSVTPLSISIISNEYHNQNSTEIPRLSDSNESQPKSTKSESKKIRLSESMETQLKSPESESKEISRLSEHNESQPESTQCESKTLRLSEYNGRQLRSPECESKDMDLESWFELKIGGSKSSCKSDRCSKSTNGVLRAATKQSFESKEPDQVVKGFGYDGFSSRQDLFTRNTPKMLTQVTCATVVSLTQIGVGIIHAFSGITLPQMTQPGSEDIYLSPEYASYFGSTVTLGAAIGGLLCGQLVSKIGHVKTIMLTQPILLILWIVMAFSSDPLVVVVSRALMGIMVGILAPSCTAYILEIAHKEHRGILYSAVPTAKQLGFLCISLLGITSFSWRHMALICGVPTTVLPFICLFFFPRSPRWLVANGMEEEAKKSLTFFRGENYDSEEEMQDIIAQVKKDNQISTFQTQCKELLRKPVLKSFLVLLFLSIFGNMHGSTAIANFTVIIFTDSSIMDSYTSAIVLSVMRVIGNFFYLALIDRIGRRPLQIFSYTAIAISHGAIGASFYLKNYEWSGNSLDWMQLVSVLAYTYFTSLGLSVLTIMQGELLPTSIRPLGMSILTFFMFLGGFTISQVYFQMEATLGDYGTFWSYGAGCLIIAIVSYFGLPETNGRSLEEINGTKKLKTST